MPVRNKTTWGYGLSRGPGVDVSAKPALSAVVENSSQKNVKVASIE